MKRAFIPKRFNGERLKLHTIDVKYPLDPIYIFLWVVKKIQALQAIL